MNTQQCINEWSKKLGIVNENIIYISNYLDNPPHELSRNERERCREDLVYYYNYKDLLESTIKELGGTV